MGWCKMSLDDMLLREEIAKAIEALPIETGVKDVKNERWKFVCPLAPAELEPTANSWIDPNTVTVLVDSSTPDADSEMLTGIINAPETAELANAASTIDVR